MESKFNHPFEHPYAVQLDLMTKIYQTLQGNFKVGIFESPTGTGKTLSLICSTMTFLREQKRLQNEGIIQDKLKMEDEDDDDDEPEWAKEAYRKKIIDTYLTQAKLYEQHLREVKRLGVATISEEKNKGKFTSYKKRRKTDQINPSSTAGTDDWDNLLPENYELSSAGDNKLGLNSEVFQMMQKLESSTATSKTTINTGVAHSKINESSIKIYFISRTHSQLSQFADQLSLTNFPSSIDDETDECIKYLPLGSRRQLCINETVSSLNDISAINEKCKDLQTKPQIEDRCQFMPNSEDTEKTQRFNDLIMAEIHDIEDLHTLGSKMSICPYYSSRMDIPLAEIVSMPYQMLLQKQTRDFLGIDLKNSIVIIDEAHNLIDTITHIYSADVSLNSLKLVKLGLKHYMKKFYLKLSVGNRVNLTKLTKLVSSLYKFIQSKSSNVKSGDEVLRDEIFALDSSDLLNYYTMDEYFNKSKIAYKLESYMAKIDEKFKPSLQSPVLFKIRSFIQCLSNPMKSGKFFFDKEQGDEISLKYLLLDPSEDFKDIVDECKCVLLAGGTMAPMSDFTELLFPQIPTNEVSTFSCDHVIPDENLLVVPISKHENVSLEFNYQTRSDLNLLDAVGSSLCKIMTQVPDGMVVFLPSYQYLSQVLSHWKKTGLYAKINSIKPVMTESKTSSVDQTLNDFKLTIQVEKKGAILFSVVGGKMSEGINFSNELARAVVMIGMPYPNAFSGELIAKQKFIERVSLERGDSLQKSQQKARDYYQSLCMKAVNQCVGRAIRNINDYAMVYLMDVRYSSDKVQAGLSHWISKRVERRNYDTLMAANETKKFFSSKK